MSIYFPEDDSYLLQEILKEKIPELLRNNYNLKVLEVGVGSGIQLKTIKKSGVINIQGVDINSEAVKYCKNLGFDCKKSNLFEKVKGKFDLIVFNSPYLPENFKEPEDSKLATTGGKLGGELINEFLKQAKKHLKKDGKIFLLISSLTKGIKWRNWKKRRLGKRKIFMELLEVWELRQ
jgi:release factor glutamine methyltransferase